MNDDNRTKRERLLSTLPREQLEQLAPQSDGAIRRAIAQSLDEADAARAEPATTIAPALRFQ